MSEVFQGLFVKFGANTVEFDKSVKGINSALSTLKTDIQTINRQLKFEPDNVDLLNQKMENLQEQARLGAMKIDELKARQRELGKEKINTAEWQRYQVEIEKVTSQMAIVDRAMQSTEKRLEEVGDPKSVYNLNKAISEVSTELDIVNRKLALDPSNVELAERKMDLLGKQAQLSEDKIEALRKEQGKLGTENIGTTEWKKLQNEIENTEIEVVEVKKAIESVGEADISAGGGLDELTGIAKGDMLLDVADKLGQVSDKLIDLGNKSMETAAKMKAADAQFATVFGDLEDEARTNLDKIGSDLDIVPERLQGSFTQIAAFAKTSGMDTASALNVTERATRAAADGAAFYDKSIEEVTENLQSFLKGNYENDAALGISATETTRNAAANELYGKSFNELSEAQKQLTLLKMVEDGNKLSGALGQASREADGFENVMGNLDAAGDGVFAAFGEELLNMLIPVFQQVSKVLQGLAEWFRNLPGPVKQVVVVIGLIIAGLGVLAPIVVAIVGIFTAFGGAIGAAIAAALPIIAVIAAIIAAVVAIGLAIKDLWENNEEFRANVMSIWESIQGIITAVMDFLAPYLSAVWESIKTVATAAWELLKNNIETVIAVIAGILQAVMQAINGDWSGAWETLKSVGETIWNGLKDSFNIIWEMIKSIFSNALNFMLSIFSSIWSAISGVASSLWNSIVSYFTTGVNNTINTVTGIGEKIAGFFGGLYDKVVTAIGDLSSIGTKIVDMIVSGLGNLGSSISNAVGGAINNAKNAIGDFIGGITGAKDLSFGISGDYSGLAQFFRTKAFDVAMPETSRVTNNALNIHVTANGSGSADIAKAVERAIVRNWSR
ncbi:TPA: phage tail tape measure protein [Streptococcus suis]